MRIYPEQLAQQLQQSLRQTYLVFGSDPLLKQESLESIASSAKSQGFEERHRFQVDNQLNWQEIYDCCQALSLFSSRQIIEITLPENGLTSTQATSLKDVEPLLHPDIVLVLCGERLNKKQESAKWFTAFANSGLYIVCNTPDTRQFPRFIEGRCKQLKLKPDHESVMLLAQWYEGNLLALSQSLMKLQLLYPDGNLTLPRLQDALSRHNHFTPFQLIDALIEGKANRAIRVLRQLQAEGTEATLLLRIIQKELIQLYKMQELGRQGMSLGKIFDHYKVWQNRRPMLTSAFNRLPLTKIQQLLIALANIETMVKTDYDSDPWPHLTQLCSDICTHAPPQH